MQLTDIIIMFLGIFYTVIWSSSFYFQFFLNIRVKHSDGYSLDYQLFNLIGFTYFSISNFHYLSKNNLSLDSLMDLVFSVHALCITIVILAQTFYYPRYKNRVSYGTYVILFITICTSAAYQFFNVQFFGGKSSDLWIYVGMSKALLSTIKYFYQIALNHDRKSTYGFSMWNVFFDIMGGSSSLAQTIIVMYVNSEQILGDKTNLPKICLSVVTIFFDFILIYQHYFHYGEHLKKKRTPLIEEKGLIIN